MLTFSRFIKNRDIFGHRVLLNFDNKGNKHATLCGGITTIILVAVLVLIILQKFMNLADDYSMTDLFSYIGGLIYFFHTIIEFVL
jgi:hypothetical protein